MIYTKSFFKIISINQNIKEKEGKTKNNAKI